MKNNLDQNLIIEILGWIGVFLILSAYILVSFQYLLAGSFTYFILNVVGGSSMIVYAYYKKSYQPLLLNAVWVTIAIWSFIQMI
jgi:hypothetical protein